MENRKAEILMAAMLLTFVFLISRHAGLMVSGQNVTAGKKQPVVVLDSGHGGTDPGKIGVDGSLEKDINLQIAEKVKGFLEASDVTVIMTREDDCGLYQEDDANKKRADMKNRCDKINEAAPILAVSIHQNSYPDEQVCGPQVFYYESSAEGKKLAICIQEALNEKLKIEHPRVEKSNRTYYLLKRSEGILNIVECGFLSNKKEAGLLVQDEYQERVAKAVEKGILKYLED